MAIQIPTTTLTAYIPFPAIKKHVYLHHSPICLGGFYLGRKCFIRNNNDDDISQSNRKEQSEGVASRL